MSNQTRVAAGRPTGGQFAAQQKTVDDVTLEARASLDGAATNRGPRTQFLVAWVVSDERHTQLNDGLANLSRVQQLSVFRFVTEKLDAYRGRPAGREHTVWRGYGVMPRGADDTTDVVYIRTRRETWHDDAPITRIEIDDDGGILSAAIGTRDEHGYIWQTENADSTWTTQEW